MSKEVHDASKVSALDKLDLIRAAKVGNLVELDTHLQRRCTIFTLTNKIIDGVNHHNQDCVVIPIKDN